MALTSAQIAAELQRKRNLGIKPTNAANMGAYNKLSATPTQKVAPAMGQPVKQPIGIGETNAYVRKSLTDNGFADSDINWDPTRRVVTVQGKDFLSPDRTVGGSSIASRDAINNAISGFRNNQATTKTNDLLGGLETAMKTPYTPPQFNYDPTTDPVYQAALRRAGANAETASGNAMAELNKRGILSSTITGDRLGQIQQAEYGRVSDEVLPQLFQQAYARHRDTVGDQYQQNRNTIGDLGGLLGTTNELGQQGRDNTYRDNTFNRGVLESDRGFNRGVLESDRGFNRGALESDRNYNRGTLESDRNYGLQQDDNSRQWAQLDNSANQPAGYDGLTANQVLDTVGARYTDKDSSGEVIGITKDPMKREQMFLDVVDMGLPSDTETNQVLKALGLNKSEIDSFTKKYSGN